MIVIFITWYHIFSIFSTVKAETIGLTDTYNLPKTSTSKLISIQSKEVNFTQDSNNSYSPLILYNANIIDGNANLRSNITIITNGDKIIEIIDKDKHNKCDFYKKYPNSALIDLSGKYVISGLIDMHAHVAGVMKDSFNQTRSNDMLHGLLTFGVTTIRNPGGPTEQSVELKNSVARERIIGPQIFTAGTLINSDIISIPFVEKKVNSVIEVSKEIDNQAKAGVDFIKLYVGLSPDLVKKAIDKAHSLGLKLIGHLYYTSWTDAANYKIDFLTHGVPVSPYLLSAQKKDIFVKYGDEPFNHLLWLELVDVNGKEINEMIDALVRNNVFVDPTLSVYESITNDNPIKGQYTWQKVLALTKKMHDSGVKLLAGTDIPNFDLVPGKSLHHELELLAAAGIPASNIIQMATKNGAEALGILNSTGTIEEGKQADLLILSSNPVYNISNTQDIEMVINNGKIVNRNGLRLK